MADLPDPQIYARLAELHGHFCPMSTLGVRLGWAAKRCLDEAGWEPSRVEYQIRTCASDGIKFLFGEENFFQAEKGKHQLLVAAEKLEHGWIIALTGTALELAAGYRHLPSEAAKTDLLDKLRTMSAGQLLTVERYAKNG